GRHSRYTIATDDLTFGSLDLSSAATVGSAAGLYRVASGLDLVASVSQSFRAPNVDDVSTLGVFDYGIEVPSPGLAPERAVSVEGGVRARAGRTAVTLTVFRTGLRDLIDRVPSSFDGNPFLEGQRVYQKANVARAFVRGAEAEAEVRIGRALRAAGWVSYTYGHQPSIDQPMRRIPPANGLLSLRWDAPGSTWVEGQWRVAGAQRRLAAGDIADHRIGPDGTDGWHTLDLYAGRRFGARLRLSVGLVNLLDEAYRIHGSGIDAVGRSAWVATGVSF
ncbi:MAG TPA: TonB-dependent receptor, partial [Vicinamibacterales bacterium]|nr:TonB-dependent receptor [Vicinamibacterales bacterium]